VDPPSAARIQSRDRKRLIRALEVYHLTGRPLTDHFADTASPVPDYEVSAFALQIPADATADRVARRVDAQFRQGLMDEVRGLLAAGVPETAHPFTGLVYRQALELLKGVRDEPATRDLIVRENRRYARRQLIWFRKEPTLHWIYASGEREDTEAQVAQALAHRRPARERAGTSDGDGA
jgi:tRNA dimethylallyltransferase